MQGPPEVAQNARSGVVSGLCGYPPESSSRPVDRIGRTDPSPMTKLTIMPVCLLDQSPK